MNLQGYRLYQTENYFITSPDKVDDALFIYSIDVISKSDFTKDYGINDGYSYEDYCFFSLRDNLLRSNNLDSVIKCFKIPIINKLPKTWLTT